MLGKEGKSPQPGMAGDTSLLTGGVSCFLTMVIYLCVEVKGADRIMLYVALYPHVLGNPPPLLFFLLFAVFSNGQLAGRAVLLGEALEHFFS